MKQTSRYFLVFALLFSVQLASEGSPPYLKYVDQILRDFEKESVKEFKEFKLRATGDGGSMPKDVAELDVNFFSYKPSTIEQARALEIALTEKLLKKINEHEHIRPYLREYPFPSHRVCISVSFHKRDNSINTDGSVAHVFQVKKTIFYMAADPKTEDFYDLHKEPYEEALKLVQN